MLVHTHSAKAVVLWPEIIDVMHAGLNWIVIAQVLGIAGIKAEIQTQPKMNKAGQGLGIKQNVAYYGKSQWGRHLHGSLQRKAVQSNDVRYSYGESNYNEERLEQTEAERKRAEMFQLNMRHICVHKQGGRRAGTFPSVRFL